jgi:hypothetical protein
MRIQDIIRKVIDIIDQADAPEETTAVIIPSEPSGQDSPLTHAHDDVRRFRQIVDLADSGPTEYGNTPKEKYADITAVTIDAGGGVNGPKHPADIRGEHPSMYPAYQAGFKE